MIKDRKRTDKIRKILRTTYPEVKTQLDYQNPFQLLIATILSAQCTDKQVNRVTRTLFKKLPTPKAFADAPITMIEKLIHSTGFFRNKAKNIQSCATVLMEQHKGNVPGTLDALVKLPGVGRKTANLVLVEGFGQEAICVDTHVHRISNRIGYVHTRTPEKTEFALRKKLPRKYWVQYNELLVAFGQVLCRPISPWCSRCPVAHMCPRIAVKKSR